jgi:hypothetical protein
MDPFCPGGLPMLIRSVIPRIVVLVAIGLAGARVLGKPGVVVTDEGRELRGDVSESEGEVRIVDKGITRILPRDRVKEIRYKPSIDAMYQEKAAALADDDVDGHYKLAEWCREQERYDLVLREVIKVLQEAPSHENARLLYTVARTKLRKTERQPETAERGDAEAGALLSEEDIQKLRRAEFRIDRPEPGVRVTFGRNTINEFLAAMSGDPLFRTDGDRRAFREASSSRKLQLILRMEEEKFADQVYIVDDPYVFREFKRRVMPLVGHTCGTSGCHGGESAEAFRLYRNPRLSTSVLYTDFLVLDSVEAKNGWMIDRDKPEESLLLEYGLPAQDAAKQHPNTANPIKPIFRNKRDPRYVAIRDWVEQLRLPRPAYGVKLPADALPGKKAAPPPTGANAEESPPAE